MFKNKICVCMLLDNNLIDFLETLQKKLGRDNPSGHITIATYENIDPAIILDYTKEFCLQHNKFKLKYTGTGIMPGEYPFLFALPKVTNDLIQIHYDFHQKYDYKCIGHTSLYPNCWNPHTSLCSYSAESADICVDYFHEISGHVVGMKVVDVQENEFVLLAKYHLMD